MGITWNIVHNTRWRTAPPVESNISEEGEYYIDTSNLFLCASASIVKENDENRNEDSEVAPVSNFLHRLWLQIDLSLNNTLVSYSNNSYPYRAYLQTLLSYGPAAKKLSTVGKFMARRYDRPL